MLTPNQIGYLKTVPEDKIANVVAFDPAVQTTAKEIMVEIESALPNAKIYYIGSSKLGIAGENDIDLTVLGEADFDHCLEVLKQHYGEPGHVSSKKSYVKWEFERHGFPVELHLSAFMDANFQEQVDTQKILEQSEDLRLEYEKLKLECNGMPWREYLKRKYEFWNRILGIE